MSGGGLCRPEPRARAPVRGVRTPPLPVATASPAVPVAAGPTGPARSVATPLATGPGSVPLCWPVTGCAAVTAWTVPPTPTGGQQSATVADHWPLTRRELVAAGLDPDHPARGRGLCAPCHAKATALDPRTRGGWNHP